LNRPINSQRHSDCDRLFAKGANYIHARALSFSTLEEERAHALFLLDAARDGNLNFVRVWGGNSYQYDYFYGASKP
jgi:hypothetical protein